MDIPVHVTYTNIETFYRLLSGFHPEILVWGGRGVAISRTMFLSPLPRVFFGVAKVLHGFQ